jgi:cell migration-inducing and hyaluronan-binding protein
MKWSIPCTTSHCRGVPLFREYLTDSEDAAKTRPQIRMMGQSTAQRSTLSLNHGAYYIDTTQNCISLGGCPKCLTVDPNNPGRCQTYDGNPYSPSIFLGGHTYYVYFLYATPTTKQKYDIYVGPGTSLSELNVTAVRVDPNNYSTPKATDGSYITPAYSGSILSVTVDLTGQSAAFTTSKPLFCRPKSYCSVQSDGSCGCLAGSSCVNPSDCSWGPNDIDCPVDPKNQNGMQCFGFSFTMPANFTAPDLPIVPADSLFELYTKDSYFAPGNVKFANGKSISPNDTCKYPPQ